MKKLLAGTVLVFLSLGVFAQSEFQEGKHYEVVAQKLTEKPTVTEFFSLYCSHCFQFEPLIDTIKTSLVAGTTFEKSHVNYLPRDNQEAQEAIVKAFATMQELGIEDDLSKQFFAAIHLKGMNLDSAEDIKQIFLANGISEKKFNKVYNSRSVADKALFMAKHWEDKQVKNVPTLLVNGKYLINMQSLNNVGELISLTNYLLEKK